MSFKALVSRKNDDNIITNHIETLEESALPQDGDVLVKVEYSTLNYKDGLCLTSGGGLVRNFPHIGGIDFAGVVEDAGSSHFNNGDKVILTGWRVGEVWWGGYSEKARVKSEWLVPLPDGLTTYDAMAIGTAGFTAMLALLALENQGLAKEKGPVLVTGATGGVGSVATAILSQAGYDVAAVTGKESSHDELRALGATHIIPRQDINETVKRPLEAEQWAGAIDSVGGDMLSRLLGQLCYGGSVAAVGLAGGTHLPASVIPFLLRGVNLLGIDSVMCPLEKRHQVWQRLAQDYPRDMMGDMVQQYSLEDLNELAPKILKGGIKGRAVIAI